MQILGGTNADMTKKEYMKIYWKEHPEKHKANAERFNERHPNYGKIWRKEHQDLVDKLKSVPCMDCKQTYLPCQMDFDHRPGTIKIKELNKLVWYSEEMVLEEAAKCDVICANCHRFRTWKRATENNL